MSPCQAVVPPGPGSPHVCPSMSVHVGVPTPALCRSCRSGGKRWQRWGRNSHPAHIHPGAIHTHCSSRLWTTGLLDKWKWPTRIGPFRSGAPTDAVPPDLSPTSLKRWPPVDPGRPLQVGPAPRHPLVGHVPEVRITLLTGPRVRVTITHLLSPSYFSALLASLFFLLLFFISNPQPVLPVFNNPGHGHQLYGVGGFR